MLGIKNHFKITEFTFNKVTVLFSCLAQFLVQKVIPQKDGTSSKVKVKVRVNIHGIFSVSSASLVEVHKSEESEEPMETDQHAKEEEVTSINCHMPC